MYFGAEKTLMGFIVVSVLVPVNHLDKELKQLHGPNEPRLHKQPGAVQTAL